MSGSSVVEVSSTYYAARLESVRMIFRENDGREAEWHQRWREENEPRMRRAKALLDKKLPTTGPGWKLLHYDETAPEIWDSDEEIASKATRDHACRFSFWPHAMMIAFTVTFARWPKPAGREDLKKHVTELLMTAFREE